MKITMKSQITGKEHTKDIPITQEQYDRWKSSGKFIQDLMPQLSPSDREFLISGATQEEWDEMFKEVEETDHEDHGN